MNTHIQRHLVAYCLIFGGLANAWVEQFKNMTAEQVNAMTALGWSVAIAQFAAAGAAIVAAYLSSPNPDFPEVPPTAPKSPTAT